MTSKQKIVLAILAVLAVLAVLNRFIRNDAKDARREELQVGGLAQLASRPGDEALIALAALRNPGSAPAPTPKRSAYTSYSSAAPAPSFAAEPAGTVVPTAAPVKEITPVVENLPNETPAPTLEATPRVLTEKIIAEPSPAPAAGNGISSREHELIEQVMTLQRDKSLLRLQLEESEQKLANAAKSLHDDKERSKRELDNANTRALAEMRQKLSFAETRIGELERELKSAAEAGAQSGNLSVQLRSLEGRFRELQEREGQRIESLKSAEAQNATLRVELRDATDKLGSLLKLSKSNDEEAKLQRRMLEESKTQLAAVHQANSDMKRELQEALSRLKDKAVEASDKTAKLERAETSAGELSKKVEVLTSENNQRKKLLEETTAQLNEKAIRLAEALPKLEAREKEIKELSARLSAAEALSEKVKAVQSELLAVRNDLLLAHEQIRTLGGKPVVSTVVVPAPVSTFAAQPPQPAREGKGLLAAMAAEIVEDKLALYVKPDASSNIVMKLDKGAVVIVESQGKEWTKIESPAGGPPYVFVRTSQLRIKGQVPVGIENSAAPDSGPVDKSAQSSQNPPALDDEQKALEQLRKGLQKK